MKNIKCVTLKLLLLLISCITFITVNGQNFRPNVGIYLFYPAHPLMDQQIYVREEADRIVYQHYNVSGEEVSCNFSGYMIERSEDGLIERVETQSCIIITDEYTYATNHKLLRVAFNLYLLPYYLYYSYDERGRVKVAATYNDENKQELSAETLFTYQDDQTIYTDSGYIHTIIIESRKYPEILTGNPDNIAVKKDTLVTEYVFDTQNRLIRAGEEYYSYQENGGIIHTFYNGAKDEKTENYYDKEGFLRKSTDCIRSQDEWNILKYTLISHYKNGIPLLIDPLVTNMQSIAYGTKGGVILTTETGQLLRIYTFNGQLVKQVNAVPDQLIPLPRGAYIVVVGSRSCKVVVK